MRLLSDAERFAACAMGRKIKLILPGRAPESPVVTPAAVAPDPQPGPDVAAAVAEMGESVAALATGMAEVVSTLKKPMRPVYGNDGQLVGAERVDNLKEMENGECSVRQRKGLVR